MSLTITDAFLACKLSKFDDCLISREADNLTKYFNIDFDWEIMLVDRTIGTIPIGAIKNVFTESALFIATNRTIVNESNLSLKNGHFARALLKNKKLFNQPTTLFHFIQLYFFPKINKDE